ncbi:MAG: hypothetical protein WDA60_17320 [Acidimicrobiia bacterium]
MNEVTFVFSELLADLRCHTSEWFHTARDEAVREQRWWRVRELAITRVLDERGQVDDSFAEKDGGSVRDVRRTQATARNLERQPNVANAAAKGDLSDEQLDQVTRLVDPDDPGSDERWAEEGSSWSPADLAARVRALRKPTMEDAAARRAARELRYWRNQDSGMLDGRFSVPDVDGALFESVFDEMIEKMRPAKGQAWASREHRGADALVDLLRSYAQVQAQSGPAPHLMVLVPPEGPATVAGTPLPDAMVGRVESVLSEKTKRIVKQRDGKCRWPGCDRRVGLEVHHCWPSSWGRHRREVEPRHRLHGPPPPARPPRATPAAGQPQQPRRPVPHPPRRPPPPRRHPGESRTRSRVRGSSPGVARSSRAGNMVVPRRG